MVILFSPFLFSKNYQTGENSGEGKKEGVD
jgi:hypothetical protein